MHHSHPRHFHAGRVVFRFLLAALFFWSLSVSDAGKKATRPKVVVDATYVTGLMETPVPNYPSGAVKKGWTGLGVFEIQFRPDGTAKDVVVVLTTGYGLLDNTAKTSLLRWRRKPHGEAHVRLTVRFTMGTGLVDDEDTTERAMTAAPPPRYPYEARRQGEDGAGVFVIRFNDDGTASDVVVLKSTSSLTIDNATIITLRHWRCRPGAYDTILVPVAFTPGKKRH